MARENAGSPALAFIVGGLVVAVAIIAAVLWTGDSTGGGGGDVEIGVSTETEVPAPAPDDSGGGNVDVKVETTAPSGSGGDDGAQTAPAQQ